MSPDVDGLAVTPPMGWNSWNAFGERVDETVIRQTAGAMAASGLRGCGYRAIVIDDCWSVMEGRDRDGNLVPDPIRFPSGMKSLADHVHDLGFEFGIYSDAAERTCAGYPGSYGYEEQDAHLWASWGIDLLKYDYCHAPRDRGTAVDRYARMGEALRATGRPIVYSICEWGERSPHRWGRRAGGHMWRVSNDVLDRWEDVDRAFDIAAEVAPYGGRGGWNDLDMLVVGLNGRGQIPGAGMTLEEYRTQMTMWCVACSPLMIGCDVRT
ncbi:MAG: glycoside hydrolase family 27 protein, partial [Actinomycetota bacterium]